jgi:hypothetical protein
MMRQSEIADRCVEEGQRALGCVCHPPTPHDETATKAVYPNPHLHEAKEKLVWGSNEMR